MSTLCDLAFAFGMTFSGVCIPPDVTPDPLPENDPKAWEFAPAAPLAVVVPVAPNFPPVVVTKTITREVMVRTPASEPKQPPPDLVGLAIAAAYRDRSSQPKTWASAGRPTYSAKPKTELGSVPPTFSNLATPPLLSPVPLVSPVPPAPPYSAEGVTSSLPVDNNRIVAADRYITGILETGINSQLDGDAGGELIIQTSRDVFGYHSRNVLIPKGSRIICDYTSPEVIGSTRLAVNCKRILLAGHRAEIFQLSSTAGDVQGRAGITGEVDNRFWEKYGSAFIMSGISASVRMVTSMSANDAAVSGSEELAEKMGEITASVLEQTVNLAPIITVPQGTRMQIRPQKDWYIAVPNQQQESL